MWELEVKSRLEKAGWICFRCASSKPVDIVAYKPQRLLRVVECKVGRRPSKRYLQERKEYWAMRDIKFLIAVKKESKK